jgi:hypothetical protein
MAKFGWAYIDCSDAGSSGSGSAGPAYSLQFVTRSGGGTTGSINLLYYTASYYSYAPSTIVLSGNLIVTGTISASVYHIEDIAIIDATGSTYFGDSNDDTHLRTGSLIVTSSNSDYVLSASTADQRTFVRGFAGRYHRVVAASYTIQSFDYILGCSASGDQTLHLPSASTVRQGGLMVIKDEYNNRAATSIFISASQNAGDFMIDDGPYYQLTGTMPAINLYSDGANWFVF